VELFFYIFIIIIDTIIIIIIIIIIISFLNFYCYFKFLICFSPFLPEPSRAISLWQGSQR
jgi:hypothetical protein